MLFRKIFCKTITLLPNICFDQKQFGAQNLFDQFFFSSLLPSHIHSLTCVLGQKTTFPFSGAKAPLSKQIGIVRPNRNI